jgi:hypothetical protein
VLFHRRIVPVIVAIIVSCGACGDTRQSDAIGVASLSPAVDDLWADTVEPYLADPLWIDRDAYDAGHYLMVPLHAAFYLGRRDWQADFAGYAQRFVDEGYAELGEPPNREARLQHLYLLSQFAVLAIAFDRKELLPDGLTDLLYQEVHADWVGEPAWHWRGDPFPGGMRERLLWKLGTKAPAHGFWRAITDEELFLLAIAADLRHYERLTGSRHARSSSVAEIVEMTRTVFEQEVAWGDDGGWVFQPGVWSDHRDYAFAGRHTKDPALQPAPVSGIAPDTSHSHRFPLWLISFEEAWAPDSPEHGQFSDLRAGLGMQFFQHVLVPPSDDFPAYRTTNYMDGRNGIYRWEYATQGPGNGYGPYELSGTMLLGWWAFLGTDASCALYAGLARSFPLTDDVVAVYVGPNTSRERHPLVSDPASYTNGFRQLIVTLAAALCDQPRWRQDVGID